MNKIQVIEKYDYFPKTEEDKKKMKSIECVNQFCDFDENDFSIRTYNCLLRAGIRTYEALHELTWLDIARIRNMAVNEHFKLEKFIKPENRYRGDEK